MPVKDLGKGRSLTIKRIRMTSHVHAVGNIEQPKRPSLVSVSALDIPVDFESHHYYQVVDSGAPYEWVVGIPNECMPGTTSETSYSLIDDYLRLRDDKDRGAPYRHWLITARAKVWCVNDEDLLSFTTAPLPNRDRIFANVMSNGDVRVQYGVKKHKRFK